LLLPCARCGTCDGGSFTTVGGATHKNIAEVNNASGAVVTAFANTSRPNKAVRALVVA